ncbi:hypothetical protein B0A50_01410 [Salinomyces thailandicus]|uniref:Letm1 RBD domain-containing protein n=1 Tax=Salinomyces thailandicus TaxID=706561 RepID=A0A4U0UBQ4_9PEZI|nr:hypothetical protein B0A50_01410 [Salinomyces thailandica]
MTSKTPASCLRAVSGLSPIHHPLLRVATAQSYRPIRRHYAQHRFARPDEETKKAIAEHYSAQAALTAVQSQTSIDALNPPRSTLPPPLPLPERGNAQSAVNYWWRIGKAYGTFYKDGVKAVWYNSRAAQTIRDRVTKDKDARTVADAASKALITRSEWQILERNRHDISKLPVFALLVLVFGEWLPLFVPFIPKAVPGTARIPKQTMGMRMKAEARRRRSFREGVAEPAREQLMDDRVVVAGRPAQRAEWPMSDSDYLRVMLLRLRGDQLLHLSATLGLHSTLWDRVQLSPPSFLLRRALTTRLRYLTVDDKLLLHHGGGTAAANLLSPVELEIACEERGLDILGKPDAALRESLSFWLKQQGRDEGRGRAVLAMLFRRLAIRDWVTLNLPS